MKLSLSEGRPIVLEQESDDSDSEIFRVKRRSSAKVVHRNANDATSPNFEQQVCFWLPSLCLSSIHGFNCYCFDSDLYLSLLNAHICTLYTYYCYSQSKHPLATFVIHDMGEL